jgi:hypothetical protein
VHYWYQRFKFKAIYVNQIRLDDRPPEGVNNVLSKQVFKYVINIGAYLD